ncbi:hypothetical protein C1T17_09605 [Sphingobium sp. SCG-1]|uniref:hypothetical protein n=1 Tax=Sphingobium sp. SCG-1 TaxID=2072936 RepID=UPI000CD6A8EB|nr:hypothetical protein [Sphingobium sp. SCG-1]AUW58319.1 hypothetical protein C1T17_09605 [Sphingobium sp. SCG-1]
MTEGSTEAAENTPFPPTNAAAEAGSRPVDENNGPSKKSVAIGAAVGIGSAAIVAALLYTRRR